MEGPSGKETVLRCPLCKKPFDKESTLTRHGYYCRSRIRGQGNVARLRSCLSCSRAKARCTPFSSPASLSCTRCTTRGIDCQYPAAAVSRNHPTTSTTPFGNTGASPRVEVPASVSSMTSSLPLVTSADSDYNNGLIGNTFFDSSAALHLLDAELALQQYDPVTVTDIAAPVVYPYIPSDVLQPPLYSLHDTVLGATADTPLYTQNAQSVQDAQHMQQPIQSTQPVQHSPRYFSSTPTSAALWTIPPTPTAFPRLFVPRPATVSAFRTKINRAGESSLSPSPSVLHQRTVFRLILDNLLTYTRMMLDPATPLPPFVHQQMVVSAAANGRETLGNCISLVQLLHNRTLAGRRLFWKNVRMECERIWQLDRQLDMRALMDALLSLCVYTLFRLAEGEKDHNNVDTLLVTATTVVMQAMMRYDPDPFSVAGSSKNNTAGRTWATWAYEESRRRTSLVYRTIDVLIYFDPSSMCTLKQQVRLGPLPAKKQLWEAPDMETWEAVRDKEPTAVTACLPPAIQKSQGSLVQVDGTPIYNGLVEPVELPWNTGPGPETNTTSSKANNDYPSSRVPHWEDWCAESDELGKLVMLLSLLE